MAPAISVVAELAFVSTPADSCASVRSNEGASTRSNECHSTRSNEGTSAHRGEEVLRLGPDYPVVSEKELFGVLLGLVALLMALTAFALVL